jgi:phosphoribulokinase
MDTQYLFSRENFQKFDEPIIIGVAGDSGSGKTRFSKGIQQLLGEGFVQTIEMDGYHRENREQRAQSGILPLDPKANRLDVLEYHLDKIKKKEAVDIPIYNHERGDFDEPRRLTPSPIILLEGLHALYPEFEKYLDFTIFVDTSRQVKWMWKTRRDQHERGHDTASLEQEMLKRESYYKRFIDFQKTSATIVIKIYPSLLANLARYELDHAPNQECYKVELLMEPAQKPLPSLVMPMDLSVITDIHTPSFMLASVASKYWGKTISNIHLDGELSHQMVEALEKHIEQSTGIPFAPSTSPNSHQQLDTMPTLRFAQLLIAWRFLEFVHQKFEEKHIV